MKKGQARMPPAGRKKGTSVYPNPSLPADLVELYREHAARLPSLASACAEGLREELRKIGVEPPPHRPPPTRVAKAQDAARKKRLADQGSSKAPQIR